MTKYIRDKITIKDENGIEQECTVEALFDVNDESYALLQLGTDEILMKVEEEQGEQILVGVDDPNRKADILDAYDIALVADPDQ